MVQLARGVLAVFIFAGIHVISARRSFSVTKLSTQEPSPLIANISYFLDRMPSIDNVIGPMQPKTTTYYYNTKSPFSTLPGVSFVPRYSWSDRPLADVLLGTEKKLELFYSSIPFETLPRSIVQEVSALLGNLAVGVLPLASGGLWVSSPGVTAALHFDSRDNYLTQLVGKKQVWLSSPREWRSLYTFSSLHPLSRQSQVPFEDGPWAIHASGSFPASLFAYLRVVTLEPGDSLFIPAFYFHLVRVSPSEGASVSVNTYLDPLVDSVDAKGLLVQIFAAQFPRSHLGLNRMVCRLFGSQGLGVDPFLLARDILRTRWSRLDTDPFLSGNLTVALGIDDHERDHDKFSRERRCRHALEAKGGEGEEAGSEGSAVNTQLLPLFRGLRAAVPDAFEMLCADFLELVAARALGTKNTHSFLWCLAEGFHS